MPKFIRSLSLFSVLTLVLTACTVGFIESPRVAPEPPQKIMPIMPAEPDEGRVVKGALPEELRDESVFRWMSGAFRIENKRYGQRSIFGSGTLCYYDRRTNTGYIISCGHLFEGGETTMQIDTWYKNGVKLSSPARYTAQVVAYDKAEDIAFLKFTPDWVPKEYFPIASVDRRIDTGNYLWSVGCDGGREVATYKVKVVDPFLRKAIGTFLITRENSPRHGRSGGGLMADDGYYVGICVRSSDPYQGSGTGLFVPLTRIHAYCRSNGLEFLLNLPKVQASVVQEIPIVDRIGPQGTYPKDYIPIP